MGVCVCKCVFIHTFNGLYSEPAETERVDKVRMKEYTCRFWALMEIRNPFELTFSIKQITSKTKVHTTEDAKEKKKCSLDCESYFKLFPWFFSSSNQRLAVIKLHLKALLNCLQYCYKWHWQKKKGCRCSKKVERFHISNPFSWWSYDYYNEKKALKIFQTEHLHTLCSCFICVTPPTVLEVPVCSCGQLPDSGDIGMCLVLQTMGAGSCLGPFAPFSIWHRPLLHLCFLQRWLIYILLHTVLMY